MCHVSSQVYAADRASLCRVAGSLGPALVVVAAVAAGLGLPRRRTGRRGHPPLCRARLEPRLWDEAAQVEDSAELLIIIPELLIIITCGMRRRRWKTVLSETAARQMGHRAPPPSSEAAVRSARWMCSAMHSWQKGWPHAVTHPVSRMIVSMQIGQSSGSPPRAMRLARLEAASVGSAGAWAWTPAWTPASSSEASEKQERTRLGELQACRLGPG